MTCDEIKPLRNSFPNPKCLPPTLSISMLRPSNRRSTWTWQHKEKDAIEGSAHRQTAIFLASQDRDQALLCCLCCSYYQILHEPMIFSKSPSKTIKCRSSSKTRSCGNAIIFSLATSPCSTYKMTTKSIVDMPKKKKRLRLYYSKGFGN